MVAILRSRSAIIFHDLFVIPVAWFAAYFLRFNLTGIPHTVLPQAIHVLPVLLLTQGAAYWGFGLYRGVWRFASLPDLMRIIKAILTGLSLSVLTLFLFTRLHGIPRSVFPIYAMMLLMFLGGSRFTIRWLKDYKNFLNQGTRVLIVGAGRAGESLVRDLRRHSQHGYCAVAFVDDKPTQLGRDIHGIRVVGNCKKIPDIVEQYEVELIIIALPSANAAEMRQILSICETTGKPVRTLPSINQLASGQVSVNVLREIALEDLLGRDPVSLQWSEISKELSAKCVLISGAGGSIGSELTRQIVRLNPSQLILIDNSEYNLFSMELELSQQFKHVQIFPYLADVRDIRRLQHLLGKHRPNIIFHAAAYKHVPILESQLREAIRNNVLGTWYLAKVAIEYQIEKFVLVSTDKAVHPTNIMGASKRLSEIICQRFNENGETKFMTVRFGNVLGSTGSVVPIFQQQLEAGGPITVTHPEITRFFMTIPEAAQLILQAATLGVGGEIFVLDMGEPIKIRYLAEQMIRLAGKKVDEEVKIVYTGLRPGEKLHEELFYEGEMLQSTAHGKIHRAKAREVDPFQLKETLDAMQNACDVYDELSLARLLKTMVPEFQSGDVAMLEATM